MKMFKSLLISLYVLTVGSAYAASDDPFGTTVSLMDKILNALTGKLAISAIALVVVFLGYKVMFSNFEKKRAYEISGGAVLIYGAAEIAKFFS